MELLTPSFGLIFWTLLSLASLLLWLIALIDILRNGFDRPNDKIIWLLVILFVPFLGPILYFAIGRKHRIKFNQY